MRVLKSNVSFLLLLPFKFQFLQKGCTPLKKAAWNGHANIVAALLVKRADPQIPSDAQSTALHDAAWGGHASCVSLLLKAGAKMDAKNKYGETPLDNALQSGSSECERLIREWSGSVVLTVPSASTFGAEVTTEEVVVPKPDDTEVTKVGADIPNPIPDLEKTPTLPLADTLAAARVSFAPT